MMHPSELKRIATVSLAVAAICALTSEPAKAEQQITCPAEVDSNNIHVTSPAGWIGFRRPDSKLKLQSAGAILGPLRDMGELIGETVKGKDGATINKFPLTGSVTPELEKWIACYYGEGIYQAIKLPITTAECAVTYRRGAVNPATRKREIFVSAITCK